MNLKQMALTAVVTIVALAIYYKVVEPKLSSL